MNGDPQVVPDVEALLERIQRQTEDVLRIQRGVEAMEVKGHSRGREVVVTLRGDGRCTAIDIDHETIGRCNARDLGEIVRDAVNNGLTKLAEASRARFAPVIEQAARDGA